jgi:hypothetical protein
MIAVAPLTSAHADTDVDFGFTITGPNGGSISFGTGDYDGGYDAPDYSMSCWEAKQYLKGEFKKVEKIECNGDVYTFKVKKFNFGPWKKVKINSDNGVYWIV